MNEKSVSFNITHWHNSWLSFYLYMYCGCWCCCCDIKFCYCTLAKRNDVCYRQIVFIVLYTHVAIHIAVSFFSLLFHVCVAYANVNKTIFPDWNWWRLTAKLLSTATHTKSINSQSLTHTFTRIHVEVFLLFRLLLFHLLRNIPIYFIINEDKKM